MKQKKRLGQVFLKDKNIVRKIVDLASADTSLPILEIGCGDGDLTIELVKLTSMVVIVEIDRDCITSTSTRLLTMGWRRVNEGALMVSDTDIETEGKTRLSHDADTLAEAESGTEGVSQKRMGATKPEIFFHEQQQKYVVFFHKDFLKLPLEDIKKSISTEKGLFVHIQEDVQKFQVVANIPYYISAKIIQKLANEKHRVSHVTIMLQKEFGKKLLSKPGQKDYTSLAVFTNYHFDITFGFDVSRQCFFPVPKVDSWVISMTPILSFSQLLSLYDLTEQEAAPYLSLEPDFDEDTFFLLVKTAFWSRRKTFMNCIKQSPFFDFDIEKLRKVRFFQQHPDVRGEKLSVLDFFDVYNDLF